MQESARCIKAAAYQPAEMRSMHYEEHLQLLRQRWGNATHAVPSLWVCICRPLCPDVRQWFGGVVMPCVERIDCGNDVVRSRQFLPFSVPLPASSPGSTGIGDFSPKQARIMNTPSSRLHRRRWNVANESARYPVSCEQLRSAVLVEFCPPMALHALEQIPMSARIL